MSLFRKLFALVITVATLVAVPACETTKGAGRDLQKASDRVERAID